MTTQTVCVDRGRQWSKASQRLAQRWYTLRRVHDRCPCPPDRPPVPPEWLKQRTTRSSSGPARTGWRRRSSWRGPGARCCVVERAADVGGGTRTAELTLPGYRARRLLGDPSARRRRRRSCAAAAGRARARVARSPRSTRPIRWTTAARWCCTGRSPRRPPAWASTRGATRADGPAGARLGRDRRARARARRGSPRHPLSAARFARHGLVSASLPGPAVSRARGRARCSAGMAAHSMLPLNRAADRGVRARAARRSATRRLAGRARRLAGDHRGDGRAICESLGGVIETGARGQSLADLPPADRCCSTSPRASCSRSPVTQLPRRYRAALGRYRYGPGVFKLDYALDGPVPWLAEECRRRRDRAPGRHASSRSRRPSAIASGGGHSPSGRTCSSPSRASIDPTRAPEGSHTLWAYCHVPNGVDVDMTTRDRGADRALRARLPRSGAGAGGARPGRARGRQPQLHRRRHQRRRWATCARCWRARCARLALHDAQPPDLPVLVVDAARRRRPRHVRLPRRPRRAVNNWCLAPIIHDGWPGPQAPVPRCSPRSPRATVMGSPLMPLAPSEQRKAIVFTISATVGVRPAA